MKQFVLFITVKFLSGLSSKFNKKGKSELVYIVQQKVISTQLYDKNTKSNQSEKETKI